jgi:hypothetical protein
MFYRLSRNALAAPSEISRLGHAKTARAQARVEGCVPSAQTESSRYVLRSDSIARTRDSGPQTQHGGFFVAVSAKTSGPRLNLSLR